ncbi:amidohydrolase [Aquiflexum gelatinilyticum]|uniref:Amidohydrolase n=1 Tax=Aquiflexum gelatinilyticum TaxID=2961943 RepID=A0A9X2PDC0_9BACT|nr:amidohydrolase [Aquiflexum gelatinilyticum]MCR9016645.1 amidohydrolase [Aquiflexum gelatinilyticum]MCS4432786.1 amidohydrolase [Aquiflexum gelatinilyticum]
MKFNASYLSVFLLVCIFFSCNRPLENSQMENVTLYHGGDILTMVGDQPQYIEALVAKDGKIAFTGSLIEAKKNYPSPALEVDLNGKTLLPGFIDAHGHIFNTGIQALAANLLPPPDGEGQDIQSLLDILADWKGKNQDVIDKFNWIIGFGYDDSQLKEKVHPTAEDLDKVSKDIPVIIIHQSGHLASMNNKGLQLMRYVEGIKNPPGGVIRRIEGTTIPNGVLEEMAFFVPIFKIFGSLDSEANQRIALAGQDLYMAFGFTTGQEGRANKDATEILKSLAQKGQILIDIAVFPDIQTQLDYIKEVGVSDTYQNHVRVAGGKISLDGSPQGKTAWLSKPYKIPPTGQDKSYRGYPAIQEDSIVFSLINAAFENNWQILAHCNGDAAADQYIRAVSNAAALFGNEDRRPVMIHSQTVTDPQLDQMKELGIIPSFFGLHTYYWGDWHVNEVLGKERGFKISPAGTALRKGMIFSQHHDSPVILPNSIMILHTVVNRTSRSGQIIGPDERISPYDALRSITVWSAFQYFEEKSKGTLEVGKLADFVVLDKNPLKVEPSTIKDIKVIETIKEGNSVYQKKD